jgi:hypothetical protein
VVLVGARALYWPARRALLIADLHLGKADVFRRAGIALPSGGTGEDLQRLQGCWTGMPAASCGSWATSCMGRRIALRGTSNGWAGANAMLRWTCMSCAAITTASCRMRSCRYRSTMRYGCAVPASP